jgi:chromate transporter
MKRAVTIILELFFVFILIGTFSFGGGNAMYPLLLEELVKNHPWLTQRELIDLFAFAQMTPGPVATNAATYAGYKIAGIPGAAVATIGVSLPSIVIMLVFVGLMVNFARSSALKSVLSGLRPVVVALILGAAIIIGMESAGGIFGLVIAAGSIAASLRFKIHPILIIVLSGCLGMLVY